jgi:hypothetical protein
MGLFLVEVIPPRGKRSLGRSASVLYSWRGIHLDHLHRPTPGTATTVRAWYCGPVANEQRLQTTTSQAIHGRARTNHCPALGQLRAGRVGNGGIRGARDAGPSRRGHGGAGSVARRSFPTTIRAGHRATQEIAGNAPERGEAVAIFGGTRRVGAWSVPRHLHVTAFFGGVELDLRTARLPPGPIDLDVTATFGGVQVIVPPTLAVESARHGDLSAVLSRWIVPRPHPDPDVPVVRIRGRAIFGGVSVETRLPGESSIQAHRRRRKERRALRHAGRRSD